MREPSYQEISVLIRNAADEVLTSQNANADAITAVHEAIALSMKEANMPIRDYSLQVIKTVNEALQKTNSVGIVPFMDSAITRVATSYKVPREPQQPGKKYNNQGENTNE